MDFLKKVKFFFAKWFFNSKWRCNVCGKEIFNNSYFCDDCRLNLPYVTGFTCEHCGRMTIVPEKYCYTCKGRLTSIDQGFSVFDYKKPISKLIKKFKYDNCKYLGDYFAEELYYLYLKKCICADVLVYVPTSKKTKRVREYNQSEILARRLSEMIQVPVSDCIIKAKETKRQAKLGREERLKNLKGAFKIINRKEIKGKRVVIIDDVTTTGSTAEIIANILKKAGASWVGLLTIASVSTVNMENI